MPHAAFIEIFGPGGGELTFATLWAADIAVRLKVRLRRYPSVHRHDVAKFLFVTSFHTRALNFAANSILLQLQIRAYLPQGAQNPGGLYPDRGCGPVAANHVL